jgi:hypothetical protein
MIIGDEILYDWTIEKMVEIELAKPDDFLKIKETLTRVGIASAKNHTLYQTANILHKRGKYYIIHFKEIFLLEGRKSTLTLNDVARRNRIISLLADWGLCKVVEPNSIATKSDMGSIKVVAHRDKDQWTFVTKYHLGKRK